MVIPCDELQRQKLNVHYADVGVVYNETRLAQKTNQPGPLVYDCFVTPRAAFATPEPLRLLRTAGKKLVFEVDDDFTNQWRTVVSADVHERIWQFVRDHADAILCSTSYLAELMRRESGGKPTFVCPNSVSFAAWQVKKQPKLTIGLTGSTTHYQDWRVLSDVLPRVLGRHPEVELLLAGFLPDYWAQLPQQFPNQVQYHAPRGYQAYPALAGSVHIGLCPVEPNDRFNWSKSGIKAIELMAAGAAVVCTDLHIYREVLPPTLHECLVAHTPQAWETALEMLVTDAVTRQTWGETGRRHVRRNYAIDQTWQHWWRAFNAIAML